MAGLLSSPKQKLDVKVPSSEHEGGEKSERKGRARLHLNESRGNSRKIALEFGTIRMVYSSCNRTFNFSSLSSQCTSICIITSTASFLVISNCDTSQKLYPFL